MITGLSGAGRSQAANHLEDLGWFVIDNLPPLLIPKVAELANAPGTSIGRVVLVVGTGLHHDEVMPALEQLEASGARVRILYLEASTEVLVRRFESTRRRHPLSEGKSLAEAIVAERGILESVRAEADVLVDTTELNVHDLRDRVVELFGTADRDAGMQTTLVSFGYKHGLPRDVDVVMDCRFLPNPFWVDDLRSKSGLEEPVREYVMSQEVASPFIEGLTELFALLLPTYVAEGKSYLTVAFGCTGGRHRSVVVAEEMASALRGLGYDVNLLHRDLDRG